MRLGPITIPRRIRPRPDGTSGGLRRHPLRVGSHAGENSHLQVTLYYRPQSGTGRSNEHCEERAPPGGAPSWTFAADIHGPKAGIRSPVWVLCATKFRRKAW